MQFFTFLRNNAAEIVISLGLSGSILEWVGEGLGWPKLTALGQKLESLGTDLPKLLRGEGRKP